MQERQDALPGRDGPAGLPAPVPATGARRPDARHVGRDQPERAQVRSASAASSRARSSARTAWSTPTTATCAAATARRDPGRRARQPAGELRSARAAGRAAASALARPRRSSARAQEAIARGPGGPASAGGFVAMDPSNGEILAMGSYPCFDPTCFASRSRQKRYDALFGEHAGSPLFNRAIAGLYPTGSTFKPITALAALRAARSRPPRRSTTPAASQIGAHADVLQRGQGAPTARSTCGSALQVSSDVFFYTLGRDLNALHGQPLQTWARKLGLGRRTGIDLPGEVRRPRSPTARGASASAQGGACECRKKRKRPQLRDLRHARLDASATTSTSPSARATCRPRRCRWPSPTRRSPTAAASPRPHLGLRGRGRPRRALQRIEPAGRAPRQDRRERPRRRSWTGLHAAAIAAGRHVVRRVHRLGQDRFPIFGKTGTAQRTGQQDQSWYVATSPAARAQARS